MSLSKSVRWPLRVATGMLSLAGAGALVLGWMIATPTRIPPPLASIAETARKNFTDDAPAPQYFQARDNTFLAYRSYAPATAGDERIAILAHGSSAQSIEMHSVAKALAAAGVRTIAVDIRGHGRSGTRGDIAYLGQLDDDLADLIVHLRKSWPTAPLTLVGHSLGGGFALRIAGGPLGDQFANYVLLAPFLDPKAPTSRPSTGSARWAEPNVPRIVALTILHRFGITCCDSLPVIGYALPEASLPFTTRQYSYRLLANYGVTFGYKAALQGARRPITVIAGTDDELMLADHYAEAMQRPGLDVKSIVLKGVSHMGIVADPVALAATVAAVRATGTN